MVERLWYPMVPMKIAARTLAVGVVGSGQVPNPFWVRYVHFSAGSIHLRPELPSERSAEFQMYGRVARFLDRQLRDACPLPLLSSTG